MNRTHLALAALPAALIFTAARPAAAQGYTLQTLASFNGANGSGPTSAPSLLGDTLYGAAEQGGPNNDGTIYSVPAAGGPLTTLASFSGPDGYYPFAGLTPSGDRRTLYGVALRGGAGNGGTVFSVPTSGGSVTTLFSFVGGSAGATPLGGLTLSADGQTLYGTTGGGGASNVGTVFSLNLTTASLTTLAVFNGANGSDPTGTLTLIGGTLYGTTLSGGASADGSVFSVPVGGGAINTLATFNGTNGIYPAAGLTLSADRTTFYGTAGNNGSARVFSVPIAGGALTTLAAFNGANGQGPLGGLTLSADGKTLFGTTNAGGPDLSDNGTVFSVPAAGGAVTTLAAFNGPNGSSPQTGVTLTLGPNGVLYGAALGGDANSDGVVFALVPNAAPEPSQTAALALGALGLSALALRARRRRALA